VFTWAAAWLGSDVQAPCLQCGLQESRAAWMAPCGVVGKSSGVLERGSREWSGTVLWAPPGREVVGDVM
jgi:hypothetical protein